MSADLAAAVAALQELPLHVRLGGAVVALLVGAIVLRLLSNTFHGRAPPVAEGVPFIGGLIKFSKVRWALLRDTAPAAAAAVAAHAPPRPSRPRRAPGS
jgi:sterol 14-demethylase